MYALREGLARLFLNLYIDIITRDLSTVCIYALREGLARLFFYFNFYIDIITLDLSTVCMLRGEGLARLYLFLYRYHHTGPINSVYICFEGRFSSPVFFLIFYIDIITLDLSTVCMLRGKV